MLRLIAKAAIYPERRCRGLTVQANGLFVGANERKSSGSLAMFTDVIRRASSLVSSLVADRLPGSSSKIKRGRPT
jgi:hypothetical protein